MLNPEELELLERTREIAETLLEPQAETVDRSGRVPAAHLQALAEAGLVGVTTPRAFGGTETSEAFRRAYHETLTAACGTTWFVLTQHLGSCQQFAGSENPSLRARFLHDMASGRHWVGVAFGHLRRPVPVLHAEPVPGGWRLHGVAPWVTGWSVLSGVIFGAVLPDSRHLFVYAPIENDPETMCASPPLPLCAMGSTETVEVRLSDLFVPEENFLRYSSRAEMAAGDVNNVVGNVAPMLGVARGSLGTLRRTAQRRPIPAIGQTADALAAELDRCRAECERIHAAPRESEGWKETALSARAWAIDLAIRASHAAVAAASGGANSLDHPGQRRVREAMFYTLYQQTGEILHGTLQRLTRS